MAKSNKNSLSQTQGTELIATLKTRFEKNIARHPNVRFPDILARLEGSPTARFSLSEMERTGGEPDVVGGPDDAGAFMFIDCSAESPAGRRSLCYDRAGWESRKDARPENTAQDLAAGMGVSILTEGQYRHLQTLGSFDTKTSSWIQTPDDIRALGGALFGDWRYGHVFIYHNGAGSYYAARGFRGALTV